MAILEMKDLGLLLAVASVSHGRLQVGSLNIGLCVLKAVSTNISVECQSPHRSIYRPSVSSLLFEGQLSIGRVLVNVLIDRQLICG